MFVCNMGIDCEDCPGCDVCLEEDVELTDKELMQDIAIGVETSKDE